MFFAEEGQRLSRELRFSVSNMGGYTETRHEGIMLASPNVINMAIEPLNQRMAKNL